jgi:hypothetical protein
MCIVIDTNCFVHVFITSSAKHPEFKPVYDWVTSGRGKIVYGGSKYLSELAMSRKFIPIFAEFSRRNKLIRISDEKVNAWEAQVKLKLKSNGKDHVNDERYNDSHLVAIFSVSGCRLLCSNDFQSFEFINDKQYYIKGKKPPSFYTSKRNNNLLCDGYIAPCCE